MKKIFIAYSGKNSLFLFKKVEESRHENEVWIFYKQKKDQIAVLIRKEIWAAF